MSQPKKSAPKPNPVAKPRQKKNGGSGEQIVRNDVAPAARAQMVKNSQPQIRNMPNGVVRIKHSEYICDIIGSTTAFLLDPSANVRSINPGLSSTFQWLASIARQFEKYRFLKLKFCYKTLQASSATGYIVLAVDYDAGDEVPVSKPQILSYDGAVRAVPWQNVDYVCSQANLKKIPWWYVRAGTPSTPIGGGSFDLKTFDVGNLFFPVGLQASSTAPVGELSVEYEVELSTPQTDVAPFDSKKIIPTAAIDVATPFGTAQTTSGSLPISINSAGTIITFNSQCELIGNITVIGTILVAGTMTNSGTATFTFLRALANAAQTNQITQFLIRASPGQTFQPASLGTAATVSSLITRFGSYDYDLA